MKQIMGTLALTLAVLTACNPTQEGYTIQGRIHTERIQEGETVYLAEQIDQTLLLLDSCIVQQEAFTFQGVQDSAIQVSLLTSKEMDTQSGQLKRSKDEIPFFLENGAITISLGQQDTIRGTYLNNLEYNYKTTRDSLIFAMRNTSEAEVRQRIDQQIAQGDKAVVANNIGNLFGIKMLRANLRQFTLEELESFSQQIPARWDSLSHVLHIRSELEGQKRVQVGQPFIDIEMKNPQGQSIRLSDFAGQGKYVLIDFWASWCGPCRRDMPTLVELYKKYKNKNFEIVGISLDQSQEEWAKGIRELQISWPQMSNLQKWNCPGAKAYKIGFIPQTYLLDPQGVIIEKRLHGDKLIETIEQLIK